MQQGPSWNREEKAELLVFFWVFRKIMGWFQTQVM